VIQRRAESSFLAYHNAENEFADRHGWRHTFVSLLVASGVNSNMAMELARHSSLELTLGRYAHVEQMAVVEAVNRMPQFLQATGTDGARLDQTGDEICQSGEDGR
jgi:integrase